jgi:methyltransferase (TIGR00027 family)
VFLPAPALLLAAHRARESERRDRAFNDPYARPLLGADVDARLARVLAGGDGTEWLFTARTVAFDRLIAREAAAGIDLVINLGAGLDARPYRLALPPTLRWVDVDLPEVLEYKAAILSTAQPSCAVTFHPLDLANPDARRGAFRDLSRSGGRALIVSEGLLIHLMSGDVHALADDLAAVPTFHRWLVDLVSPPLMEMLDEQSGEIVRDTGAPYLFAPHEGPAFLERGGWNVEGVRSLIQTALKLERLPIALRMAGFLGEGEAVLSRPWAGACLLRKQPLETRV